MYKHDYINLKYIRFHLPLKTFILCSTINLCRLILRSLMYVRHEEYLNTRYRTLELSCIGTPELETQKERRQSVHKNIERWSRLPLLYNTLKIYKESIIVSGSFNIGTVHVRVFVNLSFVRNRKDELISHPLSFLYNFSVYYSSFQTDPHLRPRHRNGERVG